MLYCFILVTSPAFHKLVQKAVPRGYGTVLEESVHVFSSQFCCPDLTQAPTTSKVIPAQPLTTLTTIAPAVQKETGKLVMLVDDFYYGTYEGNRSNAAQDNLKTPMIFKCLSCGKKLRNNIK